VFDMLFVMWIRNRRGLPMMLGSPDHFALRLRRWRLSTRGTVLASWAATLVLGMLAVGMMLTSERVALGILGGITIASLGVGLFLKRIDMRL
jgi:UDP-GlcNAc:undecaprenyl-phosphate GlcNAc-1-phosphate transferase